MRIICTFKKESMCLTQINYVFVSFNSLMIMSLMIIQKEQKVMNWSVKSTDDQTFINMFNTSYKIVMYTHVLNSLNNELKNDYIFF